MRCFIVTAIFCLLHVNTYSQNLTEWPVLKHYDEDHVERITMPVGGIGTGTVSLTGRGGLRNWEIMNRPARGFNPWLGAIQTIRRSPFFLINIKDAAGTNMTRLLEGPPTADDYAGSQGSKMENHGLPRFKEATFSAAYPFGQSHLRDSELPVNVTVKAFNPLIPGNVDDSSIPMAVLTYQVQNKTDKPLSISIAGTIQNFIGYNGTEGKAIKNENTFVGGNGAKGILFSSEGVDPESEQWGTLALASISKGEISYRTNWLPRSWGSSTLDFWNDFTEEGLLEDRHIDGDDAPMGSLAVKSELKPGETKDFRFIISWHFPNRKAWSSTTVGNYYAEQYADAWDVVQKVAPRVDELEQETVTFVRAFLDSDLPKEIKESALFNIANLRSQTVFRAKNGFLFGWEGTADDHGLGFGSCTHVWNYEQTTAFLFGDLAKGMREVEFQYATDDQGLMSFRVHLPLDEAQAYGKAAADGQMGSIMKLYREWQHSGDDEFLKDLWPKAKKALEFAWIEGGWDADMDGVMEGAQHNTMDVEYYGPNPQMGFWYLGALKAAGKMAAYLGDDEFASTCDKLYEHGSQWMDDNLFNGEYYEQHIIPAVSKKNIAPSLLIGMGAEDFENPDYQLGKGCLVDQLIGQLMAHITGLGYLADEQHVKTTLESIMKYNYRESLENHVNFNRSFALGNESVLLMASFPHGSPDNPFPYFSEVMTGFEYTAALGMLYEGQTENGLKSIQNIRDRYDGRKRSPFNEAEYGNHYARAMIAWAGVNAWTGFHYSAVEKSMSFNATPGKYFWSNGYVYGVVNIQDEDQTKRVTLAPMNGEIALDSFSLDEFGSEQFSGTKTFKEGKSESFLISGN